MPLRQDKAMKLASTRDVFAYWDRCRGSRIAPDREDIEPGAIRRALGDVFMLDVEPGYGHPFRLAGTRICAALGRELKGTPFFPLWSDVGPIRDLVKTLAAEASGAVAHVTGRNAEGGTVGMEMLLLPLAHRGRIPARLLGSLAPNEMPWWLNARPLTGLRLESLRFVGGPNNLVEAPRLTPGATPLRRPTFVVYEGGRGR
jgi:hypothetical protein